MLMWPRIFLLVESIDVVLRHESCDMRRSLPPPCENCFNGLILSMFSEPMVMMLLVLLVLLGVVEVLMVESVALNVFCAVFVSGFSSGFSSSINFFTMSTVEADSACTFDMLRLDVTLEAVDDDESDVSSISKKSKSISFGLSWECSSISASARDPVSSSESTSMSKSISTCSVLLSVIISFSGAKLQLIRFCNVCAAILTVPSTSTIDRVAGTGVLASPTVGDLGSKLISGNWGCGR